MKNSSLLNKYNTFLIFIFFTFALAAPILGFAFLSNRYVFFLLLAGCLSFFLWLFYRAKIYWWVITGTGLAVLWIYPFVFAFCLNPWSLLISTLTGVATGYLIYKKYSWKFGVVFGVAPPLGMIALYLFSAYFLTMPWEYQKVIKKQKPVVAIVFDQRQYPTQSMIRNIHFDLKSNTFYLTRGPDRKNNGAALIVGRKDQGPWKFMGKGTSQAMAVLPGGKEVVIGEVTENRLSSFDVANGKMINTIPIHKVVNCSLENMGRRLFCVSENPHQFFKIEPKSLKIKRQYFLEHIKGVYGMEVDYSGNRVFFGCEFRTSGRVAKYSLDPFLFEKSINIGNSFIWDIILNPFTKEIYVTLPLTKRISVLDPDSLEEVGAIPVSRGARDLLVGPKGKILYISNFFKGHVTAYDLVNKKLLWKVNVGPRARGMTYDPHNDVLYVGSGLGVVAVDCSYALFNRNRE